MGEILECLEDLNLMSRRRDSTWQKGSNETDLDDGVEWARWRNTKQLTLRLCSESSP